MQQYLENTGQEKTEWGDPNGEGADSGAGCYTWETLMMEVKGRGGVFHSDSFTTDSIIIFRLILLSLKVLEQTPFPPAT